jgi:type III restriction enzyme
MLGDLERAKIVITNFHAFKLRERMNLSKGGRSLLQGTWRRIEHPRNRRADASASHARLDGHEEHLVLNDEAHHCYREKQGMMTRGTSKGTTAKEAEKKQRSRQGLDFGTGGHQPESSG